MAEDDPAILEFLVMLLERQNYELMVACNGFEALRKAREHEGPIDLLLSDIEMPEMSGVELAIQLNRERPDTKIMLISGNRDGMLVLNNGWAFLPKPFLPDMLRDRIRDFLSEVPLIKEHVPELG